MNHTKTKLTLEQIMSDNEKRIKRVVQLGQIELIKHRRETKKHKIIMVGVK